MKNLQEIPETQFANKQPDKPGEIPVVPNKEPEKEKPTVPNREEPFTDPDTDTPSKDPGRDEPLIQPQDHLYRLAEV